LAKGGIEREIYKKLIAPFMHDMPSRYIEGFRRACAENNYAYVGPKILKIKLSLFIPCKLIELHANSYKNPWAYIMSKNNTYKSLFNWR
jgi:hypothetical protein